MSDQLFAFDQPEMNDLIGSSAQQDILVSVFRTIDPSDNISKLFLAARPFGTISTSAKKIPVGCPVPPGWSAVVPTVTTSQLVAAPTFILAAEDKEKVKKNGATKKDQLLASLKGFDEKQPSQTGELSFKVKDNAGNTTKDIHTRRAIL